MGIARRQGPPLLMKYIAGDKSGPIGGNDIGPEPRGGGGPALAGRRRIRAAWIFAASKYWNPERNVLLINQTDNSLKQHLTGTNNEH